jgi:hypothetical protein
MTRTKWHTKLQSLPNTVTIEKFQVKQYIPGEKFHLGEWQIQPSYLYNPIFFPLEPFQV